MGQIQSSQLIDRLQTVHLEELLNDEAFISDLQTSLNSLSPDARSKLQAIVAAKPATGSSTSLTSAKLKSLLSVKANDIELSSSIQDLISQEWTTDWTTFFHSASNSVAAAPSTMEPGNLDQLLRNYYREVLSLQSRRVVDKLRWRFYTMFFYDLNLLINRQINLTARASNNILTAIAQNSSSTDMSDIERNLKSWVTRGHRYRNLSEALGGSGCLFYLPEAISDYVWEEALPLNGPKFEEACDLLRSFSIAEKASLSGAAQVATAIESGLLAPFQWNVWTLGADSIAYRS